MARRSGLDLPQPRTLLVRTREDVLERIRLNPAHNQQLALPARRTVANGVWFQAYIEQVLVPELRPGDIVMMDNLGSHKGAGVRAAI
jgi:hypothetical protein